MKIKNETEVQLMKILFKTSKKKPTKNLTSQRAYPHGVERKYFRQLQSYFKPLTDYVKKYLSENIEAILRGDSHEIKLDAIPGKTFDKMIYNLENWLSIYMPDISELDKDKLNNVIFTGLGKTADETMAFSEKEFEKMLEKGIHVSVPTSSDWWGKMKTSWAEDNYTLITSNAKNYVSKINTLVEQGVVNGQSIKKITDEILKATDSLTKKHCKLLARDQVGKLTGQINQSQMEEIGLNLYVWDTSMDDRVRESHAVMQGLLCRWDDASVCSYDGGQTWEPRPSGAIDLHPGQDIQCRCSALSYYPELIAELEGTPMEIIPEDELYAEVGSYEDIMTTNDFVKNSFTNDREIIKDFTDMALSHSNKEFSKLLGKINETKSDYMIYENINELSSYHKDIGKIILRNNVSPETFRHEVLHFLDDILGKNGQIVDNNGVVRRYRWNFSKSANFSKTYLKELNNFVDDVKNDIKTYYSINEISKSYLEKYLNEMKLSDRESLIIQDMFTAKERKSYGGHLPKYFNDTDRIQIFKQLENEKVLSEGFSELNEMFYGNDISKTFKDLISDKFSDSILIIKDRTNKFLGV